MKKLVFTVLLGVAATSAIIYRPWVQAAGDAKLYLSPASASVSTNETLTLALREDSGSEPVNATTTHITYSPSKLQFLSITASEKFSIHDYSYGEGLINVNYQGATTPVTSDQLVATIKFKVIAASGSFNVTVDPIIGTENSSLISSNSYTNVLTAVYSGSYNIAPTSQSSNQSSNSPPPASSEPSDAQNNTANTPIDLPAEAQGLKKARQGSHNLSNAPQSTSKLPDETILLTIPPAIILAAIGARYLNLKYGFLQRRHYHYAKESVADMAKRVNRRRINKRAETVAELAARMHRAKKSRH